MDFIEDEVWKDIKGDEKTYSDKSFENCTFQNCSFVKSIFHKCLFIDCHFTSCDLSMSGWSESIINNAHFEDSKLTGIDFSLKRNKLSQLAFNCCNLNYSIFTDLNLPKSIFIDTTIRNSDFTGANLKEAVFTNCDLADTRFFKTYLQKADFNTAENFSIDPENNNVKKAIFSYNNVLNLLNKYELTIQ